MQKEIVLSSVINKDGARPIDGVVNGTDQSAMHCSPDCHLPFNSKAEVTYHDVVSHTKNGKTSQVSAFKIHGKKGWYNSHDFKAEE